MDEFAEVEKALVAGAQQALKIPMSYDEFRQAALRTYIRTAVKESGDVQRRAAMKIGVTEATISNALTGKALSCRAGTKPKKPLQK